MKKHVVATKKQLSTLTLGCALIASTALALVNCTDPASPAKFTVTFSVNGGSAIADKIVEAGKLLAQPKPDPTKEGYSFAGWYKDQALTQRFEFSSEKITANFTLYAKWELPSRVTIPDPHFRAKLQALIPNAFVGEKLNVTRGEVIWRKQLDVSPSGTDSIKDLTGIQYFTALTELRCNDNRLTDLDLSKNTQLTRVYCYDNSLTDLNMSNNTKLTVLHCDNNRLTDLDVSNNTRLMYLECDDNRLTDLDVSNNTQLTHLDCHSNHLTTLDVSKNTRLTRVECDDNRLTDLDVSKNTPLISLYCSQNSLTSLDVSKNTQLTRVYCYENSLTDLDVSNNTKLTSLRCNSNRLTNLDVSKNTALIWLQCGRNQLTYLDMRGMRRIEYDLSIQEASGETNAIETLKVHENLQDNAQISAVKTTRGDKITISTYSAATGSTTYTAVCNDYDPTADDRNGGKGVCN